MDLKWLEDFISLAKSGSFSRSAEERHVTQSAFSRRIQALEAWLGVPLIDRSTYPTLLTPEGRRFRETAEEAVRMLHASRVDLQAADKPNRQIVAIAAIHTLSLRFFPRWFRLIEMRAGPLTSRLLPDDFHTCLQAIEDGSYDFLLTFYHPNVPISLDPDLYPHQIVGADGLVAVRRPTPEAVGQDGPASVPLLSYAQGSFLGRIAAFAQAQTGSVPAHVAHTNENAMAEALKFMALEGHGSAWMPRSLVAEEIADGRLVAMGPEIPLEVRLYRSARRKRAIVERVWSAAKEVARDALSGDV